MLSIIYDRKGVTFSDFEIREMFVDTQKAMDFLTGKQIIEVATGHLIRLIQLLIAKKLIQHEQVILIMNDTVYGFTSNGQLDREVKEDHCFSSLGYEMSKAWLSCWHNSDTKEWEKA